MSLINKMLQDLDARRPENGSGTPLPNDVRPLPALRPTRFPVVLTGLLLISLLVLAGTASEPPFLSWDSVLAFVTPSPAAVAPVAPQDAPVAALPPVVEEVPARSPDEDVSPEHADATGKEAAPPAAHQSDAGLRMAEALRLPGTVKAAAQGAKTEPAKPQPTAKKSPVEREDKAASPASKPVESPVPRAAKAAVTPTIERTEVLGSPRERAEAEYRKAIAAVNQGRVTEALEGLRNALQQDVLHVASRQLLVRLLLESRRSDEAIQALQEGLQGQPAQTGWAMSLARMQVERGDFAAAWQTLDHSLPAAAGSADYQGFAGHVLQRLGRHKESVERYQAASRLSPQDGRWWLGLGLALDADGRSGEAREAFLRARQSGNLSAELMGMVAQKLR